MAKPSQKHAGAPALVSIGIAIRSARLAKGLSQELLAHATNIDRSYMGGIERGEHNLSIMNLLKISRQLGIKVSELFEQADL